MNRITEIQSPAPAAGYNPGIGAALAADMNRERNYRRALNSPTAQANRLAATGNPLPIAEQKQGYMPPDWSNERSLAYLRKNKQGASGETGKPGAPASPYRRNLTPAEGIAFTRKRSAELAKSLERPAAPAPAATTTDPNAGLQNYARQKLGGTEFRISRRHPAREPKARMGEFAGMTPDQASIAAENQYAGLSPAEKTQWANRSDALRNPVAPPPAPPAPAPKSTGVMDTLVNLFRGGSAPAPATPAAPAPPTTAAQPPAAAPVQGNKRPGELGSMSYRFLKPRQPVQGSTLA